jgi:hypothetical protein
MSVSSYLKDACGDSRPFDRLRAGPRLSFERSSNSPSARPREPSADATLSSPAALNSG